MGEVKMIDEIERYVGKVTKTLTPHQKATLKSLLFSGYKGERDYVLLELLKTMGEKKISHSELTEGFTSTYENETVKYSRIKPEYYRAVRKILSKK